MAKENVKRGTVVLVRYPFTDLSSFKVRPAVVMTANELLSKIDDVLCLFISSTLPEELLETDFVVEKTHPAFQRTGLQFRSVFRTHKLALLHKSLVLRVLGELNDDLMAEIDERLLVGLGITKDR
jgi:mRNA interferase MazF